MNNKSKVKLQKKACYRDKCYKRSRPLFFGGSNFNHGFMEFV
jgi:hypothetical protein